MTELSQNTKNLILKYSLWSQLQSNRELKTTGEPVEQKSFIHVDEVASQVAVFYEQIRTVIDWKEEHLMRRAAIIRKLKRRFSEFELDEFLIEEVAEPLVLELIRGGYFPNNKIEESKILDVKKIIKKYVFILKSNPQNKKNKKGLQLYDELLEIAACEIEETLAPSIKEMALIEYMFEQMKKQIKVNESIYEKNLLKKEDKDTQIYIAVQKSLFMLDEPIISYNLLKYKYDFWESPSEEEILKISQNIYALLKDIKHDLSHPMLKKFYSICEKYDTVYLLLGDIISIDNSEKTTQDIYEPSKVEELIKKAYEKRFLDLKAKIKRAAIYSTASIFITKILSLLILEIILAKLIYDGHINFASLTVDTLIPTGLMAFLVINIKPPSNKNLNLAVIETMKIIYQKENLDIYEIKPTKKKGLITKLFLSLIYLLGAVVSFSFIFWIFNYLQFSITSIVINFIFIALILFAGTAIKKRSEELTIEEDSGGLLEFIYDILFLPITDMGRWLSNTWKQYNAIAAFFNALIDMPFSAFVEFLERWRHFIREKKKEIR